jgi:hypothetical protein
VLTITNQEAAILNSSTSAPPPGTVKEMVAKRDCTVPTVQCDSANPTPVTAYDVCHRSFVFTGNYNDGVAPGDPPALPAVTCVFPRGATKAATQAALAAISSAVGSSSLFS